jgi:hypothetical protein
VDPKRLITAGYWSTYWFSGYVYGSEMARGLVLFRREPSAHLTRYELEAALTVRVVEQNTQLQRKVAWPAVPAVAHAYLDQLARSRALPDARTDAVRRAVNRGDRTARAAVAKELEGEAERRAGVDAQRLRALAATILALN